MSQIDELREIIVGDNAEQLSELKDRIENVESRTRDVLEVLPPAIDAGIKQDGRLLDALKIPVSESVKHAIRVEPDEYAEILYPVMGPSIRRAISQAISSLLITINQSMASATSVSGIRTRIQSLQTGVPYAELVLRQSLKYKVEHVYLIDRDTGMMLAEVAGEDSQNLDSDAVSAMFSAIQSFVQDSFSKNEEDRLTDFKVGEHKVWIAHGPNAMLACVIFGEAPETLKYELYDVLDNIRTEYSNELSEYKGDGSEFVGVDEKLSPLLHVQMRDGAEQGKVEKKAPSLTQRFLMMMCVLALAYFVLTSLIQKAKLNTAEHYLRGIPGLVMTNIFSENKNIIVEGLRDPLAQIPYSILGANGVDMNVLEMRTAPFRSLDPSIEKQRLIKEITPPAGVNFQIDKGVLKLVGYAPIDWLLENDARIRQLSIEGRFDATQLYPSASSLRAYFSNKIKVDIGPKAIEVSSRPWLEQSFEKLMLEISE